MPQQAQITSVEAIESFRASLIVYLSQARPLLEEISHEAVQTRLWLQNDQRRLWDLELRRRQRKLEEARQELFAAKLSSLQEASSLHYMAVQRAQRAVQEAEGKLAAIKKWNRDLEDRSAPLTKQVEQLQGFLVMDMGRAVAYLDQILNALAAYRNVTPAHASPGPANHTDETENPG
ncbi:MAG: hypothetical protein ABSE48_00055 [Verrucomicrobiota bacterium]|jgi:hypothetical protein